VQTKIASKTPFRSINVSENEIFVSFVSKSGLDRKFSDSIQKRLSLIQPLPLQRIRRNNQSEQSQNPQFISVLSSTQRDDRFDNFDGWMQYSPDIFLFSRRGELGSNEQN
jgi:hypothetical protein